MADNTANSSRIAKNTFLLYARMLFLMVISLYTARVVLASLGVEDYGIYNVVGGIVTIFTMVSSSLQAAISRFITFELGRGDVDRMKLVFSSSIILQWLLAIIFLLLAESIGLWFVNAKLVIPAERLTAANWVYQFTILTFFIQLISVPYNSCIIAHEKISVFAYISIFDGVGRLLIAYIISVSQNDRLILYALLVAVIAIIVRVIYGWYCKRAFEECKFKFQYDKETYRQIFSFAGWNVIGATSAVCKTQGVNILINMFCGPAVNAARGIAVQVNAAVQGFVSNFQTALNPQIIKSYASGDKAYFFKLVFFGARYSYYILFIIVLTLCVNSEYVLSVWLKEVPLHTKEFLILVLILSLFEALSGPLSFSVYAIGDVKMTQIIVGGLYLLNLPISYICLRMGMRPESVYVVAILISLVCLLARLAILKNLIGMSPMDFMKRVFSNVMLVSFLASVLPMVFFYFFPTSDFLTFLASSLICVLGSSLVVLYVGCGKSEREFLFAKVRSFVKR